MPRATNSPASRNRRKRIIKRAKGFRGFRSKLYRYAKDAVRKAQTYEYRDRKKRKGQFRRLWIQRVRKAQTYEYRDRKKRKGQFRRLWIQRISAGTRAQDITYSRFIEGLKAANIEVDRKILADLAVHDIDAFNSIVAQSKVALAQKAPATA